MVSCARVTRAPCLLASPMVTMAFIASNVDIVVTAETNEEATDKIRDIVQKTLLLVGEAAVIRTPNGFTIVPHFPLKHVQVLVLWTRTLLDYLLFVDLDCTALAYDGVQLLACPRSLAAFCSRTNYVQQDSFYFLLDRHNNNQQKYAYNPVEFHTQSCRRCC